MMSALRQDLLQAVKSLAPPLSYELHKGESGRIGIIGGSKEYTGAPYFAGITALRVGADLVHIFCPPEAAPVIKSYSPELIVHPSLYGKDTSLSVNEIAPWFPRLHSLVVGPGLGRDPAIMKTVQDLLKLAKDQQKDIIIDADGLHLITESPQIIAGYTKCILTPNAIEFKRLNEKMRGDTHGSSHEEQTRQLALSLGGVTIVRKGHRDIISNGTQTIVCEEIGSPRRPGGQGDLLSGCLGLLSYWSHLSKDRRSVNQEETLPPSLLSSYGSCLLIKKCAHRTYTSLGRSMLAGDMVSNIGLVTNELFDR